MGRFTDYECPQCKGKLFERNIFNMGLVLYSCRKCNKTFVTCQDIISEDEEAIIYQTNFVEVFANVLL